MPPAQSERTASGGRGRGARATLDSVAARAGVSRQTVSNVINLPHLVRMDTAERVRAVISELDYRPHPAAQQLRTRRSQLLGLRVYQAPDPTVFDRFLHRVTEAAADRGYRIMLYTARDDEHEIDTYAELLDRWNLDGLVLSYTHAGDRRASHLSALDVPFATFGRPWDGPGLHSWVDVDGAAGTRAATEHLINQGHRAIGYIGWPEGSDVGDDRLSGWAAALRDAGLPAVPPRRCLNEITGGQQAAAGLLDEDAVTAIVCVSDLLALGALSAAATRGLDVGRDVAIIGFDDSDVARVAKLSSVSQPLQAVADECVGIIVDAITSDTAPSAPRHVLLPPTLELRASTEGPR